MIEGKLYKKYKFKELNYKNYNKKKKNYFLCKNLAIAWNKKRDIRLIWLDYKNYKEGFKIKASLLQTSWVQKTKHRNQCGWKIISQDPLEDELTSDQFVQVCQRKYIINRVDSQGNHQQSFVYKFNKTTT